MHKKNFFLKEYLMPILKVENCSQNNFLVSKCATAPLNFHFLVVIVNKRGFNFKFAHSGASSYF